jgi:hypothetical protein
MCISPQIAKLQKAFTVLWQNLVTNSFAKFDCLWPLTQKILPFNQLPTVYSVERSSDIASKEMRILELLDIVMS